MKKFDERPIYYVYAYMNPMKECFKHIVDELGDYCFVYEPIYIGKGHGKRVQWLIDSLKRSAAPITKNNTLSEAPIPSKNYILKKINKIYLESEMFPIYGKIPHLINITEYEALCMEEYYISQLGRKIKSETGVLYNIANGGPEEFNGISAFDHISKCERSRRISEGLKKFHKNNPNAGKEIGSKIKGNKNGKGKNCGSQNVNYIELNVNKIIKLREHGMLLNDIATFFGCSRIPIKDRLIKNGIKIVKNTRSKQQRKEDFEYAKTI